jgi:thymidylate kinase
MFIVIEGIDLVGKTIQHAKLVQCLSGQGFDVASYSFPAYRSPTGEVIRSHLEGRVLLDSAEVGEITGVKLKPVRSEHDSLMFQCLQVVDKYAAAPKILRDLRSLKTVVCCRWWQSALAYGLEASADADWVRRTTDLLPRADVNILLDLDPCEARRRPGVSPDRLEVDLSLQSRVRQRYLDIWKRHDDRESGLWTMVDAEGDAETVHGRILTIMKCSGILLDVGSPGSVTEVSG